jgi:uncharacterized protein with FMN-binding domain
MANIKKIIIVVVTIMVLIGGFFGGKYLISVQKYQTATRKLKITNVDLTKINDGKYIGSCDTGFISATVSVTVKTRKITNITLLRHKTEKGKAAEVIPSKVLEAQSLQVDTITGATNSSKVILKSIETALESGQSIK